MVKFIHDIRSAMTNRWFRLVLWFCVMLLSSCPYYGWQFMRQYMERDGVLSFLCPNGEITCEFDDPEKCPDDWIATGALCKAQADAFATGNTIASGMEYGMGLFAGILFDNYGPFITACVGIVAHLISWLLILNPTSTSMFYGGMALLGGAVNFICFPSLMLIDIFPGRGRLMNGVVLCAQVGAALQMPLLWEFRDITTWQTLMYTYTLAFILPLFVVYLLSMPWSRKSMANEYIRKGLTPPDVKSPDWKVFLKCLTHWELWAFLVWYVLLVAQTNFYNAQLGELTSQRIAEIIGYIWMVQGPMSLLLAWINDAILPTIPVCGLLNAMMIVAWCLSANYGIPGSPSWTTDASQLTAGALFVFQNSHIYTTKYNFAFEMFPPEHLGKVAGGIGVLAGLLQQLNIVFDTYVKTYVSYIMYGTLAIPEIALLIWLYYRQFEKKVNYGGAGTGRSKASDISDMISGKMLSGEASGDETSSSSSSDELLKDSSKAQSLRSNDAL